MVVSRLASKINLSKILTKQSPTINQILSESKQYPSVTKILSVLTEGKFGAWKQTVALDSFKNQVLLRQKKQPHRIFTEDDLNFLKRIAESSPQQELQKRASVGNETHALLSQIIAGKDIKGKSMLESFF